MQGFFSPRVDCIQSEIDTGEHRIKKTKSANSYPFVRQQGAFICKCWMSIFFTDTYKCNVVIVIK